MNVGKFRVCILRQGVRSGNRLDWPQCERQVRRLQARIVKATQEGRWGKVKALQRLLTHSFSGKALAVKRVTDNQGRRTSGVDGKVWRTPASKHKAIGIAAAARVSTATAATCPHSESQWEVAAAGHPDDERPRHASVVFAGAGPVAETTGGSQTPTAFVLADSTADAIEQCFTHAVPQGQSPTWVLEGDIRGCFDNISHEWMLRHVPADTQVLWKWLKAGYVENRTLFPTEAGTPQGGIISPTLANMILDGLEPAPERSLPAQGPGSGRGPNTTPRFTSFGMRTTSSSPARPRRCWKMKSDHWSSNSWRPGLAALAGENPHHAYR